MANYCSFDMKITGSIDSIEEMIAMLSWEGKFKENGLGRVFSFDAMEVEETDLTGIYTVNGYGDCAWSVLCAMREEYRGEAPSLEGETERLGLVLEVYSSEPGCCFQEHYLFDKGKVVIDDCVDYEEHCIEAYNSLEEYNRENNTNFTEDMINENGDVCIGGFGDKYGEFEEASRFFRAEPDVSKFELDELEVCVVYDLGDEFASIVKAPNGRYFNFYSKDQLEHRYGSVGPFESFDKAEEMMFKHRPKTKGLDIQGFTDKKPSLDSVIENIQSNISVNKNNSSKIVIDNKQI